MSNTIKRNESSPSIKRGGKLGSPALNPIGLSNARGGKGLYLDGNVAKDNYVSEWARWSDNEKAQAKFSQPVRSRMENSGNVP